MNGKSQPDADRRLKPIDERLAGRGIKVLSIDVFDTLLWRRVPEAHDVFLMLGAAFKRDSRLAAHVSSVQFAELRHQAELRARARKEAVTGYREIVLADIYREIPDSVFGAGFDHASRVASELTLERGLMCGDGAVAALMKRAKAAGAKVILVSDTYFSATEVADFLRAAEVDAPIDRLVVSCEVGRPKWRDLFPHLLRELGVAAGDMLHLGDAIDGDVAPCNRAGIPVIHYDKWAFGMRARDREFPAEKSARAAVLVEVGDLGLTGLRSRLFHRAPVGDRELFWRYGAATLAPPLALFARWVVRSAQAMGVSRLYGIMREGRFLKRLVEDAAKRMGVRLQVEELWLSRRAVIRAAFAANTPDLLTEFVLLTPGRTTAEILANMGLTASDLAAADPALTGYDIGQGDALMRLCDAIARHASLREKTFAMAARLRRGLLAGLANLPASEPVVLLDLGYMATIQSVLARLLRAENTQRSLTGLYFALNDKAVPNLLDGVDARSYLNGDGFSDSAIATLTRTPDVLEHACMCDEGSPSHYDDSGTPVLLANQRSRRQLDEMATMQDGIIAGFDERRQGAVELRLNAFGRGQLRVTLKGEGPEASTSGCDCAGRRQGP